MRTITVSIDELDFSKLGFREKKISFAELKEKISILYAKEALLKCHRIAGKTGLAKMTLKQINAEIKAARKDAKSRN